MFWLRCAAALALAPILSGEVIQSGLGVYGDFLTLLFPYLWLFLVFDWLIGKKHLKDEQIFILGAAFGFLYKGVYDMSLHDGASPLGVNWGAVLAAPAEWGMFSVLLFRVLSAIFPRGSGRFKGGVLGWGALAAIGAIALGRYLVRLENGTFVMERLLGNSWPVADLAFAGAAVALLKPFREGHEKRPIWVWICAAAAIWVLGASLAAQTFGGALNILGQTSWLLVLGACWVFLRGAKVRHARRWIMWAAAARALGAVVFAVGDGVSGRPSAQLLASLAFDLPAKALFFLGFLTGKAEV